MADKLNSLIMALENTDTYDRENALIDLYIFLISQNSSLPKVKNTFIFVELSNWRDCSLRDGVESYYETKDTDELNFLGQHRTIAEASAVESPIRQETIGFPAHFFARAHNFKPPGRACQPEADSPMRT